MTTIYAHQRPSRVKNWPILALGAAALVLIGGASALAIVLTGDEDPAAPATMTPPASAATTRPLATVGTGVPLVTADQRVATALPAAVPARTTLSIGDVSGAPLVPVEAAVTLTGADALGSVSARLTYDPAVVTLVGVRNGDVPQATLTYHHDADAGEVILLLTSSRAAGVTGDHALALLTFEAQEGTVGTTSPLTIHVRGAATATGESTTLQATNGEFRNGVPGDVQGDGVVDQADYDQLAAYLVGEPVGILVLNADLNEDGNVTQADAVRLHQYLDGARDSP